MAIRILRKWSANWFLEIMILFQPRPSPSSICCSNEAHWSLHFLTNLISIHILCLNFMCITTNAQQIPLWLSKESTFTHNKHKINFYLTQTGCYSIKCYFFIFKPDYSEVWWEFYRQALEHGSKFYQQRLGLNKTVTTDSICWGQMESSVSMRFEGKWIQIFYNLSANGDD